MQPIHVGSKLVYQIQAPTTLLVNVAVAENPYQHILNESLVVTPHTELQPCQVDIAKNRFHRLTVSPGEYTIEYNAQVQLQPVTEEPPQIEQVDYALLPADVLPYLNPSRYCESDKLGKFAESEFGSQAANFQRVNNICDWICNHLQYQGGVTDSHTTACDVLLARQGVCRDFAHLAIAFCRALGVPARYVSGYACRLEPPDFHGFFEAYLGDRWFLFDPTRLAPPAGLVRISVGRDAADAAFATIWGAATLQLMEVYAQEQNTSEQLLGQGTSETAVSTA